MYESEVYPYELDENLPNRVLKEFSDTISNIEYISDLHWSEHCTECAMPGCFKTCDLYVPRKDGKCQRFVNGIEKVKVEDGKFPVRIFKISFKKWGVWATQGNNELYDFDALQTKARKDLKLAKLIHMAEPGIVKKNLIRLRYRLKKDAIKNKQNGIKIIPDAFVVEVYNPSESIIPLDLTIRNEDEKYRKIPFQYLIKLNPGYNKETIPFDEIAKRVKTKLSYRIDLTPDIESTIPLYFGMTEFVKFTQESLESKQASKIKCVVWDLDNTVWTGTLVEDGLENLVLKEGIEDIFKKIEDKGIINSVSSKNNENEALDALRHFNLIDYFLFPKISWAPKSKNIKDISLDLNINANTFLFIDDSEFERNEVENNLPEVRVMDAIHYESILNLPELQLPVTEESKKRKQLYSNEVVRKRSSDNFDGEYFDFLRSCEIQMTILPLSSEHFDRVHELAQRTNQMNFSGNRYKKDDILEISKNQDLSSYVMKCSDKFGEYGVIGFGIIKKSENRLIDLMFSCRIQSKRVEHAFLTYCLDKYNESAFKVSYKRTEKNKFSAQVFYDFGFEVLNDMDSEGVTELEFKNDRETPDDKIIIVDVNE